MVSRLTIKELRSLLSYDRHSGLLHWKVAPNSRIRPGSEAGALDDRGYRKVGIMGRTHYAHRLAFAIHHGRWPGDRKCVDHRNGDPSDNRIENLREATFSQNLFNQKLSARNTSGFKGLSRSPSGKWIARVNICKYLGTFETAEEARAAYAQALTDLAGEFANFGERH